MLDCVHHGIGYVASNQEPAKCKRYKVSIIVIDLLAISLSIQEVRVQVPVRFFPIISWSSFCMNLYDLSSKERRC